MLNLSDELISLLKSASPKSIIKFDGVSIEEYQSKVGDSLYDGGFLNVIARYENGEVWGFHISTISKSNVNVKGQPKMKRPNMSFVVGIAKKENYLCVNHWDGFESIINMQNLKIVEQNYTK